MATRYAAQPNPAFKIKSEVTAALATNRLIMSGADTYLAIASPTNAQIAAQVRALTQAVKQLAKQNIGLCRIMANQLESAD
jgi:hypothetical protein